MIKTNTINNNDWSLSLLSPIKTLNIVVVDFSISNWDTEAVVKPRDTAR